MVTNDSENPPGADNQQGSLADIAWLAGHTDGDGWVGIIRAKRTGKTYYRYTASTCVMTTSRANATKVAAVYEVLGANVYVQHHKAYTGKDGSPRREKWNVSVRGNADARKVLAALEPYMAEKKPQARIVIEYVNWRDTFPARTGGQHPEMVESMRDRAEEAMSLLRIERFGYDPSETTCGASSAEE